MLKAWLNMIFGPNGELVVQKMQEWARNKLEVAFDKEESVPFLETIGEPWHFYGNEVNGKKQGKAQIVWWNNEVKTILHGFFHDNELVGNIHIEHLGKKDDIFWDHM